jgi:hypothetical protein
MTRSFDLLNIIAKGMHVDIPIQRGVEEQPTFRQNQMPVVTTGLGRGSS